MKCIFRLPAVLLLAALAAAQQPSAREVAQQVEKHYDRVSSMRAEFTESYRGAGIERVESGTVWLKKPGRMRWEYREPREKLFVSDGRTAYFYVPGERQARRAPLNKLDDLRTPLRFLLGKADLEKELDALSSAECRNRWPIGCSRCSLKSRLQARSSAWSPKNSTAPSPSSSSAISRRT
jgi:outer membrane lipoprotein carrier protein